MARLGLLPEQVVPFVQELVTLPGLVVEGIFTHFSVADSAEPQHQAHTRAQLAAFQRVLAELRGLGIAVPLVHAANSAAMLSRPASHFNMVRLGIALYGLAPSAAVPLPAGFRPALSWKTQVAQVKTLAAGRAGQLRQHLRHGAGDARGRGARGLRRRLSPRAGPLGPRAGARPARARSSAG